MTKYKSVSDDEMVGLYSDLALSLNITELRDTYILKKPVNKTHLRAFEIPMCGGLQLASYTEELSEYFKDGKEIVLYHSKEEMVDKAKFYLDKKNESLVNLMKKSSRARAEKDILGQGGFNEVFKICK